MSKKKKRPSSLDDHEMVLTVLGEGQPSRTIRVMHSDFYRKRSLSQLADIAVGKILDRASDLDDRSLVLTCQGLLEEYLMRVIAGMLHAGRSTDYLLGVNGALGSFGAKTKLAVGLGLLSESDGKLLGTLAAIRNEMAHQWEIESLEQIEVNEFSPTKGEHRNEYLSRFRLGALALAKASLRVRRLPEASDGPVRVEAGQLPELFRPEAVKRITEELARHRMEPNL